MPAAACHTFDYDAPPDWRPLERLETLTRDHPTLPHVDADRFMYMGRAVRAGDADVHLYKHIDTRRHLNLDDAGHAYVTTYLGRRAADTVTLQCRPLRDLASALDRLRPQSPRTLMERLREAHERPASR